MANGSAAGRRQMDRVSQALAREEPERRLGRPQFFGPERLSSFFQVVANNTPAGESDQTLPHPRIDRRFTGLMKQLHLSPAP